MGRAPDVKRPPRPPARHPTPTLTARDSKTDLLFSLYRLKSASGEGSTLSTHCSGKGEWD